MLVQYLLGDALDYWYIPERDRKRSFLPQAEKGVENILCSVPQDQVK